MPREIISIHVGRSGSSVGVDTVARMCLEHEITPDGKMRYSSHRSGCSVFFSEQSSGRALSRSLFVDLKPTTLNEIGTGDYRSLFRPEYLVSGSMVGSAKTNNFAIGKNLGKEIIERLMNSVRKLAEDCDMLQGFNIYNASGGGTGAGLTSLVCENLGKIYKKQHVLNFSIDSNYSSPDQAINHALGLYSMQDDVHINIPLAKNAVKKLCQSQLLVKKPTGANLYRHMARVACATTASLRFPNSQVNTDLREFGTNLIPYPSFKFILSSYGPLIPVRGSFRNKVDAASITNSLFTNTSVVCNAVNGSVLGATVQYRGDFKPDDIARGRTFAKGRIKFVDWTPTGFKAGHMQQPPINVPRDETKRLTRSAHMLSNNSAISEMFVRCADTFDKATDKLSNSSKMSRYTGAGIELGELREARGALADLLQDYQEVVAGDEEEEEEEDDYPRSRL